MCREIVEFRKKLLHVIDLSSGVRNSLQFNASTTNDQLKYHAIQIIYTNK